MNPLIKSRLQKDIGKFNAQLLIGLSSGDMDKVASFLEREFVADLDQESFHFYLSSIEKIAGVEIDFPEDEEILKEALLGFGKKKNTESPWRGRMGGVPASKPSKSNEINPATSSNIKHPTQPDNKMTGTIQTTSGSVPSSYPTGDIDESRRKPRGGRGGGGKYSGAKNIALATAALVPVMAFGGSVIKDKLAIRKAKKTVLGANPTVKTHKKQAEKFFDTVMAYAPALHKAPFVVANLVTGWISSGQEYITHPQIQQLIELQEKYQKSRGGKASRLGKGLEMGASLSKIFEAIKS